MAKFTAYCLIVPRPAKAGRSVCSFFGCVSSTWRRTFGIGRNLWVTIKVRWDHLGLHKSKMDFPLLIFQLFFFKISNCQSLRSGFKVEEGQAPRQRGKWKDQAFVVWFVISVKTSRMRHIREVLQHVILAKKPYERRLRGAAPILYVILVRKPRNERPRYGLST